MNARRNNLYCREIMSTSDPAWEGWLELYYASFPISEQMSEAFFVQTLDDKFNAHEHRRHVLALTGGDVTEVKGMAFYEIHEDVNVSSLWYIAVCEKSRSRGIGTHLYQQIIEQVKAAGMDALIFEVEIPGEDGDIASRRIGWYRRQGAQILEGIEYIQELDTDQPPLPMHLMIHPFIEFTPDEAFSRMKVLFQDQLNQTGQLMLK